MSQATQVESDCLVLLARALLGQVVYAFGEDGCGKYGQCDQACHFSITDVSVRGETVKLTLLDYDARVHGHVMTDKNLEISLAKLLRAVDIDPRSLLWQDDVGLQGTHEVVMDIDVGRLVAW